MAQKRRKYLRREVSHARYPFSGWLWFVNVLDGTRIKHSAVHACVFISWVL